MGAVEKGEGHKFLFPLSSASALSLFLYRLFASITSVRTASCTDVMNHPSYTFSTAMDHLGEEHLSLLEAPHPQGHMGE